MIRILVVSFLMAQPTAVSAADVPTHQLRSMSTMVKRFSPSIGEVDVRTFVAAEAEVYAPMLTVERAARLELAAKATAATADAVIRHARANDLEATRSQLRELLRQLAHAGGLMSTPSREELGGTIYALTFNSLVWNTATGLAAMMTSAYLKDGNLLIGGAGWAVLNSIIGMSFQNFYRSRKFDLRFPGGRRLARLKSKTDLTDLFWNLVRTEMKEDAGGSKSAEYLGRLIARELKNITLDQACTSALLLAPSAHQTEARR